MSIYVAINFPWTSQRDQNSCIYLNVCNLVPQFQALYHTLCGYFQNLNTPPTRGRVAIMYLFVKSCRYVAISFPWTSERDQNSCIYPNVCKPVPQFQALYHTLCRYFQQPKLIATYRHDFRNKYITATRALVGGVFRFWKYRHHVQYRAWNCGTRLQTFGYMHEFLWENPSLEPKRKSIGRRVAEMRYGHLS